MRAGRHRTSYRAALAALVLVSAPAIAAEPPERVVSMNVCTDQMAMLLAAPGQLLSVSYLASDPGTSAMAAEAAPYRVNHGLAEEIFLLEPDIVIAGTFSTRATVSMLRRLGFPVEEFAPETSFDDVKANILRMGQILGQHVRAEETVAALDEGLRRLRENAVPGLTVASYSSNSYTAGEGSLSDAVIAAAGMANLGSELGIRGAGRLPLEVLVLSRPEIVTGEARTYGAPALAQQNFVHPAYRAVYDMAEPAPVPASYWICGGPYNLVAAAILQDAARAAEGRKQRGQ